MRALTGFALALAAIAGAVFAGVAIHELNYASANPYSYGPAKVIAWAALAGALLALAVILALVGQLRRAD